MSDILLRYGEESERGSLDSSKLAISEGQLSIAYKNTPNLSDYVTLPSKDARIYFDLTNTERIPVNAYFADHAQDAKEAITLRGLSSTVGELNSLAGITGNVQEQLNNRLPLSGGTITDDLIIDNGSDLILKANSSIPDDAGDIIFLDASGNEIGRIWKGQSLEAFNIRFGETDSEKQLIHSGNIGSQSVNYASSAGQASRIPVYTSDPSSLTAGQIWINTSV